MSAGPPSISVVIPTFNRAPLLRAALESLTRQTLPRDAYEVIAVSDGSTDGTEAVLNDLSRRLPLTPVLIEHAGNSVAKNVGVERARAPLVFFFDDDDIADPNLLHRHVAGHQARPDEHVAVLGHTTWSPQLDVTPLMHYVVDIGQNLFAYKRLRTGDELDYRYFWSGRISCKRAFLSAHAGFDASFPAILEDVELGYRLSLAGLAIVFDRQARSFMNRPLSFDDFCRRCERVGEAIVVLRQLHPDPAISRYCDELLSPLGHDRAAIVAEWRRLAATLPHDVERVGVLEGELTRRRGIRRLGRLHELRRLYGRTFRAFTIKGAARSLTAET